MKLSRRFSNSSPKIAFARCGADADSTLLLLHGVTRLLEDWQPVFARLDASWSIVACDHRGHGDSDRASSYLVMDYVEDCVDFLRNELASPVTLVGHSLGAMVAAAVSARIPEYVNALVLEDPPFESMGSRIAGTGWQHQFLGMKSVAQCSSQIGELTDSLSQISIPVKDGATRTLGELRTKASLEWSASCLQFVDPEVFTPLVEGRWLEGYDRQLIYRSIECDTLLLQADPASGGALCDQDATEAVSMIANCRHVRLAGRGHQLHRDFTDDFLSAFDGFIEECQW